MPLLDAADKAAGRVKYLSDQQFSGLCHAVLVRSPHAHALVEAIDTAAARGLPGVLAVLGPDACPPHDLPGEAFYGRNLMTRPLLWREPAWLGCPVAVVVAESMARARAAARLVQVRYKVLPHVLDLEQALAKRAVPAHLGRSNLALPFGAITYESGDTASSFASARHVVETVYHTSTVQAAAMEPYVCVVEPGPDGGLVVHKGTPSPYELRHQMAHWLGLRPDQVRVVVPAQIGGGFGSRMDDLEYVGALCCRAVQRPVRLELERSEGLVAGRVRHGARIRVRSALDDDGNLLAREVDADYNAGAHLDLGPYVVLRALRPLALYRCQAVRFAGRLVTTNAPVASATRGFGNPQATFAVESHNDELCRRFGLDPIDWRRRHLLRSGDPNLSVGVVDTGTGKFIAKGATISSCALEECLAAVRPILDAPAGTPPAGWVRGKGVAVAMHTTGKGRNEVSNAKVVLRADGAVEVHSGAPDQGGTGVATTLALISAEVLGVLPQDVQVVLADTAEELADSGAHASGRTYIAGETVRQAAVQAKQRRDQGEPLPIVAAATWSPQTNAPPFAACVAVVDVDPQTGQTKVVRLVQAVDIGRVLNPLMAAGQIQGAAAQGLGFALTERLDFSPEGKLLTRGLLDYGVLRSADMPELEVIFCGQPEPSVPLGVKGAGEIGLMAVAPAVANAIADATGARVRRLPMDGETVWHALES